MSSIIFIFLNIIKQNKVNNIKLKQELGFKCTRVYTMSLCYIRTTGIYIIYTNTQCQLYVTFYPYIEHYCHGCGSRVKVNVNWIPRNTTLTVKIFFFQNLSTQIRCCVPVYDFQNGPKPFGFLIIPAVKG